MKHRFISKKYWKDKSTAMGKSDELAKGFDDVINLSLGDPDLITDDRIIDAAFADAKAGHTKYTDFRGDPELRAAIRDFYGEEYGIDLQDEEIFVAASGCHGMYLALEAILDPDDEVILQTPYFTPYPQQVELAGGIPVELPTFEEEDFKINTSRLESLINERTKALVINTPSNPTGNCLTEENMQEIGEIAQKHDLIVIADDIYTAFSYQSPFVPFLSIPGMRERTITINSFSKNFTMTGWRIGNIIAPDYLIRTIQTINQNVVFTAPSISQRAAIAALKYRRSVQPPMVEEYRSRTYYAAELVNGIEWMSTAYPPKGSFYLFVNIRKSGLTSEQAAEQILKEAHVLTLPGNAFGRCGEGYLRIACTVGKEKLKEAFERIARMEI